VLGCVPFDENVTKAMVAGKPVVECYPDTPSSKAIVETWKEIVEYLKD